ncbi:hypothetical protein WCT56_10680 [Pectobacterium parmentieri]|uniref:Uncharacterized protein n=1 Tax=Pectobacterium parvum TaxID=2778550 RepID=A0AAP9IGZ8_9GAMM|nr:MULTISPECIES: hypothetical protein [Pectobacterium]AOR60110.1 hypothetical protein A8F97_14560 [Pectobacterium parmentieri]MBA0193752.1 hypothetical protein [Pectobacterium carotovorum]MBA0201071.1 hypothetical protein [Pectobacterium carotovorum]MBI0429423.1 hypothetical protein [Pectobacterium parmentieri]PWD62424.1 hypothetical protein DF211_14295 [Pectobacterium parmentieri]
MNHDMKPLLSGSQGTSVNVLYFDAQVGEDDLYECATSRLNALLNLNSELARLNTDTSAGMDQSALSEVNSILLSDAITMLNHLHNIVIKGKRRGRSISPQLNDEAISGSQEVGHA